MMKEKKWSPNFPSNILSNAWKYHTNQFDLFLLFFCIHKKQFIFGVDLAFTEDE